MTKGIEGTGIKGLRGALGRLPIGVALALLAAGCEQNGGNLFSQASPAGEKGSTDGTIDSHVPRLAAVKRRESSVGPRTCSPER